MLLCNILSVMWCIFPLFHCEENKKKMLLNIITDWTLGEAADVAGFGGCVSHHWAVDATDAVVTHVQRGEISPHRDDSGDRTPRLHPLRLPLRELTRLWDEDRLRRHINETRQYQYSATHNSNTQTCTVFDLKCTIIDSVERWMLIVTKLDLREDKPRICWELHSVIWRKTQQ